MSTAQVGWITIRAGELRTLGVDLSAWTSSPLEAGISELVRIGDGQAYPRGVFGAQVADGPRVVQQVTDLEAGQRYWLILVCTAGGERFAPRIFVDCPSANP